MGRKYLSLIPLIVVVLIAYFFYSKSLTQSSYNGLPTVPCIDQTQPIKESFSFHVSININGKTYPVETNIGHDYGQCLHTIYTNNSTGTVFVRSNTSQNYTLGDFFRVWHKTFNQDQIFDYKVDNSHSIRVLVNGSDMNTFDNTVIKPADSIEVIYQ